MAQTQTKDEKFEAQVLADYRDFPHSWWDGYCGFPECFQEAIQVLKSRGLDPHVPC